MSLAQAGGLNRTTDSDQLKDLEGLLSISRPWFFHLNQGNNANHSLMAVPSGVDMLTHGKGRKPASPTGNIRITGTHIIVQLVSVLIKLNNDPWVYDS